MKFLIKLAIAALVANACFRIGTEYLTYIKFRDSIRDAAMSSSSNTPKSPTAISSSG